MVRFIAEVSSNHSQDLHRCLEFIDVASDIGCDGIKFQLFKLDSLFAPEIIARDKTLNLRKKWELPLEFLPHLRKRCDERNIELGCTPFYLEAVKELLPYVDFYKIASYELLWDELLIECAKTQKPLVIATGMATMQEVLYATDVVKSEGNYQPHLLHCVSSYPISPKECNLKAIDTIRSQTGIDMVGWSDHSANPAVIYRAVHKYNASMIEFHLDLDGKGAEFNQGHCWLPNDIKQVIYNIKQGEIADGNGKKFPQKSELNDVLWRADPSDGLRPFKELR